MDEALTNLIISCIAQIMLNENVKEKVITIDRKSHKDFMATIGVLEDSEKLIKVRFILSEGKHEPENTRNVPKGYH